MPDLCINNLHIRFDGVVALDNVSFTVREGEIFSLVGPNGSGKSTLFNCISGFDNPQKGTIRLGEIGLLEKAPHQIIGYGISRTFQNLQNSPYMTVLDNVLLGAHTRLTGFQTIKRWVSRDQRQAEESLALAILDFLGIDNYEQKYLSGLPFVIQKLVEIARALVSQPKLILMDEPAAGMNEQETLEIATIISEIRADLGITVLVVEHDMSLVMDISDRVCVLDSGTIITIGAPQEIKHHPEVVKVFLGDSFHA